MRAGVLGAVLGAAALSLSFLLLAAAPGQTQAPPAATPPVPLPLPGYLPPYEVTRIVRSAGFDPLARPLREGTTYVLRATDFRGILMRVVVDAQSGAIRAVNRIVTDPGPYGQIGMLPPPYGAQPPYGPQEFDGPEMAPNEESAMPSVPAPAVVRSVARPLGAEFPPLPRPRPAELVSRRASDDAKPALGAPQVAPSEAKKPLPIQLPD